MNLFHIEEAAAFFKGLSKIPDAVFTNPIIKQRLLTVECSKGSAELTKINENYFALILKSGKKTSETRGNLADAIKKTADFFKTRRRR